MLTILLDPGLLLVAIAIVGSGALVMLRRELSLLICLALAAFLLGAGRAALSPPVGLPAGVVGQEVSIVGMVDDQPQSRRNRTRLSIRVDQLPGVRSRDLRNLRVQATVYGGIPVHYGDLVLLRGRLDLPPSFEQFDYRAYLAEQGIAGVMTSARVIRVSPHPGDPLHTGLFASRQALVASVDRALPEPQAALVLGVVFGYRATLPVALEQAMIASGLIHIVVISGLKISLLARIIHQALGRLLPGAAPLVAVGAMIGYALLAGASAAALRAAAMGVLVVIAGRLRRDSHVLVSLALTAAIMLGLKPGLARDVSFQLSFAGTAGIAAMTDGISARLKLLPSLLREPFAATVAAEAATWPLMLANFHQLSIVAPAANALVLPLLPAVMIMGGAGALLGGALPAAAWPLLQAAGMIASWYRLVIDSLGSLPVAAVTMPYFPPRWIAAAVVLNGGALAAVKLRQFFWHKKVWAVLGAASLATVALLLIRPDGRAHVYALDVGTGSAVLVRTANGHQLLIDAGPDADKFTQAIGRALPPTARTIDIWLITGGRRANIGAADAVLNRFHVGMLVIADADAWSARLRSLAQSAQASGIPVTAPPGALALDGVRLSPAGDRRSWLIETGVADVAIVSPETSWQSLPAGIDGAVFTEGGPAAWQGPGQGFSVIQIASSSRDGLPVRAVLQALDGAPLYRTDRLGTVELVAAASRFSLAQ